MVRRPCIPDTVECVCLQEEEQEEEEEGPLARLAEVGVI